MTDLSMVTILSLVCSVTGAGLLAVLALSLKVQGNDTDKQVWNRRMLAAGGLSYLIGLLLPLAFLPAKGASAMAIGTVMIGVLVTGLLAFRRLRRVLAALCFLSAVLVIGLVPHLGWASSYMIGLLGGGLLLTALSMLVDRHPERQKQRQ